MFNLQLNIKIQIFLNYRFFKNMFYLIYYLLATNHFLAKNFFMVRKYLNKLLGYIFVFSFKLQKYQIKKVYLSNNF